jgi:lipopolysaccharide transport system permease protein
MFDNRFISNFTKYKFLLVELVKRDIKGKYKDSVLGLFWSFLNPLLTMVVLTFIFSYVFKMSIKNFPVYFLTGYLIFNLFSAATSGAMDSIKSNASIIKKIYLPKYMFALGTTCSELINFAISLIVLILVMIATNAPFHVSMIFTIIPVLLLVIMAIGVGLILATLTTFFTDIKYLYGVFIMTLMYASAIFYPVEVLPVRYQFLFELNPVYLAIAGARDAILTGVFPNMKYMIVLSIVSVVLLAIGMYIFYKYQDKFILYL